MQTFPSGGPSSSAGPVDAVIFDWGGTLTPWHAIDLHAQWVAFAEGVGTLASQQHDVAAAVLAAEDAAWQRGRSTGSSARLAEILAEAGFAEGDARTVAGQTAYETFWEPHTFTDPAVAPLWTALREKGIRVGVLSNTIWTRDYHRAVFARDGVEHLIDADVYSSEVPWVKPQAEIFREAARRLGVDPRRCVYVGDRSYEDVHGPQQVGMRAIWVPHSDIPEAQQVSHDATPDAVAHELDDVLGIVTAWDPRAER